MPRKAVALIMAATISSVLLGECVAQTKRSDDEAVEYDRRVAATVKSYSPPSGYVPDVKTAVSIATAVALPIYGKKIVDSELPLIAKLKNGVWTVIGQPPNFPGGELIVQINEKAGTIVFVGHTQ